MKALTVQPPWSWAIRAGHKTIENRSWGTDYRGPLVVCSGARWSRRGGASPTVRQAWHGETWNGREALEAVDFGPYFRKALCLAELADCHPDGGCCRPWGESTYTDDDGKTRTTLWHWVLEDIRPLDPPLAAKGRLGLWTPDPDLRAEIERQLG